MLKNLKFDHKQNTSFPELKNIQHFIVVKKAKALHFLLAKNYN